MRKFPPDKEIVKLANSGKTATRLAKIFAVHKSTMWANFRRLEIPTISWSKDEIGILKRNGHLQLNQIQHRLELCGYHRSLPAIAQKRKRMRCGVQPENSLQGVADGLGAHIQTVIKWIKEGKLKAQEVPDHRPAGFRYIISEKNVREFIIRNPDQLNLGKVDKYWFIDILASSDGVGPYAEK